MAKNPWTRERLEGYIGQEEGYQLEFKSSRGLSQESPAKFITDLTCHVSAFLNSDGGVLIIGIEEAPSKDKKRAETAIGLSDGVPRSRYTGARLQSSLCAQISPSVASYVQVLPVVVGESDGEDLLAFVIEVSPGVTAYQAADKLYYARRSFSSEAMDDKDIRLRMLTDDRPRGRLAWKCSWNLAGTTIDRYRQDVQAVRSQKAHLQTKYGDLKAYADKHGSLEGIPQDEILVLTAQAPSSSLIISIDMILQNVGNVTIREGAAVAGIDLIGMGSASLSSSPQNIFCQFDFSTSEDSPCPLYPEMERVVAGWRVSVWDGWEMGDGMLLVKDVSVYLDNGPPVARSAEFDLTDEFRDVVLNAREKLSAILRGE